MEPIRRYTPAVTYHQAWVDAIDFKNRTLTCAPATPPVPGDVLTGLSAASNAVTSPSGRFPAQGVPFNVHYDKLVIGVGAYAQTFGIPGVKEHAHFLKDVNDARGIRSRILQLFEQASQPNLNDTERGRLLHFCVVGGGPTGVEFSAELYDFIARELSFHYPTLTKLARITLYDVAPKILQTFDAGLSEYAEKKFARKGVTIKGNSHVTEVGPGHIQVKEEGKVYCGLLVWSTGLAPNPLVLSLKDVQKDEKTQGLRVDENLNLLMKDGTPDGSVWAIGDASAVEGGRLPATAQVASQQAKYLVKRLNALARGKRVAGPFKWHNKGSLAYIGGWEALIDRSQASEGPQSTASGRLAWLIWRSAYFTGTLSWRNKIVVPFYWFLNAIFGRDISRF